MKLIIISDAHQNEDVIKKVMNIYKDQIDVFLCAGDSCLPSYSIFPFISIKGNCDYFPYDELLTIHTPIGKLLMRHYPFYNHELEKYKSLDYKIFIYGHTHKKEAKRKNDIYIFNPGSISYPRDNSKPSYLFIEINDDNKTLNYEFKFIDE